MMFYQEDDYDNLAFLLNLCVSSGNCEETQKILTEHSDQINAADNSGVDGEEGRLFGLGLNESPELLTILIDNYVEVVIKKQETDRGRQAKKALLSEMLERQIESLGYKYETLSDEYKELLAPWLLFQEYISDDDDISKDEMFGATLKAVKDDLSLAETLSLMREESSGSEQDRSSLSTRSESSTTTLMVLKDNLSGQGFTLPHFQHLSAVGFEHITESDMHTVLDQLEVLKSKLHHIYCGNEYTTNKELIENQIELVELQIKNVKLALADDSGDFEFPTVTITPDFCDYSAILRQKDSPMLEAVRQNLDTHGFRLPDEIITLDEAIVALEKISSELGYVYSGCDYETNKEFIESQITDIKLSASAETAQRMYAVATTTPGADLDFSTLSGAAAEGNSSEIE